LQGRQNYYTTDHRVQLIFYSSADGKRMPLFPSASWKKKPHSLKQK